VRSNNIILTKDTLYNALIMTMIAIDDLEHLSAKFANNEKSKR